MNSQPVRNVEKPVKITEHARLRLMERVGSCGKYGSWKKMVKTARYRGRPIEDMLLYDPNLYSVALYVRTKSTKIMVLDEFAFIFKGNKRHARTLITVMPLAMVDADQLIQHCLESDKALQTDDRICECMDCEIDELYALMLNGGEEDITA
ncbi:MAG: hypothetical protein IKR85_05560 [Clostridia bacterium]|nr:hypothetical protein [Clostridia bacterium]